MKTFSLLQQKTITESNQFMSDMKYLIVEPLCGGCYETDCSILQNESVLFKTVTNYKEADYLIQNCFTKYCLIIEDKEIFDKIKENYCFLR